MPNVIRVHSVNRWPIFGVLHVLKTQRLRGHKAGVYRFIAVFITGESHTPADQRGLEAALRTAFGNPHQRIYYG